MLKKLKVQYIQGGTTNFDFLRHASIGTALTEKGRLIGASRSEQMFEHISIISNNFRTFVWALYRVNIQDCRL